MYFFLELILNVKPYVNKDGRIKYPIIDNRGKLALVKYN